jgi:hypothetical protein
VSHFTRLDSGVVRDRINYKRGKVVGRQHCRLSLSLILLGAVYAGPHAQAAAKDPPANQAARQIHDEAHRILSAIKLTEYRHDTDIEEKTGTYYCDCSGFVGYVLNRTVAKEDPKGPLGDKKHRPLAMDYERAFEAAPEKAAGAARWQKIVRVSDTRPGDVVAWRHEVPKPGNTGHVVIVDSTPILEKDGLVRVVTIDSTTLSWTDDSGMKRGSGVGRRTMWFKVDADGHAIGYVRGSRTAKPKMEAIAIGRALIATEKHAAPKRAA